MKQHKKLIPTVLAIAFLAIGWQLIAMKIGFPAIFPSLIDLLKETGRLYTTDIFFIEVSVTILRGIIGFCLAFTIAFLFAIIAAFSSFWKAFFQPLIIVSRSIPIISLVLIALLWFSPPQLPIFIALITMFPILYQSILTGLEQTDKRLLEMSAVFGKTNINQFIHIYLPSGKKVMYGGVKTAMGFGWRAIIMGEVLSQPVHGIGSAMKEAQIYINVSEVIAWTVVAIIISYLFEFLIKLIQQLNIEKFLPKAQALELKIIYQNIDILHINVSNLTKYFNGREIIESYSSKFSSDKINCLKGHSGKGKTTLLRLLAGLEKSDSGEIKYSRKSNIGYSFQDVRLLPWLTVAENIAYALNSKHLHKQEISNRVNFLLEKMELSSHVHKYPHELSGGQQQRVGLARSLAVQSDVLLLDEPLTGLDNELKIRIIRFLSEWFIANKPLVIWVTHEEVQIKELEVVNCEL